jgi:hypothetical protein
MKTQQFLIHWHRASSPVYPAYDGIEKVGVNGSDDDSDTDIEQVARERAIRNVARNHGWAADTITVTKSECVYSNSDRLPDTLPGGHVC